MSMISFKSAVITPDNDNSGPNEPLETEHLRKLCHGTNINAATLLTTDYLNHFNEIIMLLEMVPSMPAMFDDIASWQPISYIEHFQLSHFPDKELAIKAFSYVPDDTRHAFEKQVSAFNDAMNAGILAVGDAVKAGMSDQLNDICKAQMLALMDYIDRLSAIINGTVPSAETIITDENNEPAKTIEHAQDAIDALFDTP